VDSVCCCLLISVADWQQRRPECDYEMTAHQPAVQTDSMTRVCTADKSTNNGIQCHLSTGGIAACSPVRLASSNNANYDCGSNPKSPPYVGTGALFTGDHAIVRVKWRLIPFSSFSTSATDGQTDGQTDHAPVTSVPIAGIDNTFGDVA